MDCYNTYVIALKPHKTLTGLILTFPFSFSHFIGTKSGSALKILDSSPFGPSILAITGLIHHYHSAGR